MPNFAIRMFLSSVSCCDQNKLYSSFSYWQWHWNSSSCSYVWLLIRGQPLSFENKLKQIKFTFVNWPIISLVQVWKAWSRSNAFFVFLTTKKLLTTKNYAKNVKKNLDDFCKCYESEKIFSKMQLQSKLEKKLDKEW